MHEHYFQCPHCWEEISMLLDPSVTESYIEDCEVCCNPIAVQYAFANAEMSSFLAQSIEQ